MIQPFAGRGRTLPFNFPKTIALLLCASFTALAADSRSEGATKASSSPASASQKSGKEWIAAHKDWIIAGGGALFAGIVVWALVSSEAEKKISKPSPIGNPPGDPVVQGNP